MSDLPTWARVLLYGAGAIAAAVLLYAVVYLAVRAALRRQQDVLRAIATSAEYVADVADAWAEREAERRAGDPSISPSAEGHHNARAGEGDE